MAKTTQKDIFKGAVERFAPTLIKRGVIWAFNDNSYTADVLLIEGNTIVKAVPVSYSIPARVLQNGNKCSVVCFDPQNPRDGYVADVYSGTSPGTATPSPYLDFGLVANTIKWDGVTTDPTFNNGTPVNIAGFTQPKVNFPVAGSAWIVGSIRMTLIGSSVNDIFVRLLVDGSGVKTSFPNSGLAQPITTGTSSVQWEGGNWAINALIPNISAGNHTFVAQAWTSNTQVMKISLSFSSISIIPIFG